MGPHLRVGAICGGGYLKALLRLGTFKYDRRMSNNNNTLSADWRRIPLRQCQECPQLVPAAQERCNSHERQEPLEYVIRDSSGRVLDRWVESDDDDPCCDECLAWATGADVDERTKLDTLQDSINAAHERQQWAQQGVFLTKRDKA